jgi:hypothetical protein
METFDKRPVFGADAWSVRLLCAVLRELDAHDNSATILRVELLGPDVLRLYFTASWLTVPNAAIEVCGDAVLPWDTHTAPSREGQLARELDVDDLGFDIAMLYLTEPFGPEELSGPDADGQWWRDFPERW